MIYCPDCDEAFDEADVLRVLEQSCPNCRLPVEDMIDTDDLCPACNGSGEGMAADTTCQECKGKGVAK